MTEQHKVPYYGVSKKPWTELLNEYEIRTFSDEGCKKYLPTAEQRPFVKMDNIVLLDTDLKIAWTPWERKTWRKGMSDRIPGQVVKRPPLDQDGDETMFQVKYVGKNAARYTN